MYLNKMALLSKEAIVSVLLVIKFNILVNLKKKRQRCGKWLLLKLIQLGFFNETIKWQTDKPFKKDTFWTSLFTSFGQTNLPKLIRTILCIIFVYPNHFLIFVSFIILINILIKINSYFLFKKKMLLDGSSNNFYKYSYEIG